tara:strand:- start:210 stop:389 length:180 start_codon:yes stop_codon:yes gene_type:complete
MVFVINVKQLKIKNLKKGEIMAEVSNCCDALPWHLETYDNLGICSSCKEHAVFEEEEED